MLPLPNGDNLNRLRSPPIQSDCSGTLLNQGAGQRVGDDVLLEAGHLGDGNCATGSADPCLRTQRSRAKQGCSGCNSQGLNRNLARY